ncbi:MAG: DUF2155 domain-containing protein [Alphaproteobacteria bacterium]
MKNFMLILGLFSPVLAFAGQTISHDKVEIRVVNRIKGLAKTIVIPTGESAMFENISITVEACYEKTNAVGIQSNYWGFLKVKDLENEATEEKSLLFSGWMSSLDRSQATVAHPVYDIWVQSCIKNSEAQTQEKN